MRDKLSNKKNNSIDNKKNQMGDILPNDFNVVDIIVRGKKVLANVKSIMEISDCDDEAIVKSSLNKVASYYFYFGRVVGELEDELNEKQEDFDLWFASKMGKVGGGDSEKAKERIAKTKYETVYREKNSELKKLSYYCKQADIAKKALEKSMSMMQSIGAFLRIEKSKPDSAGNDFENDHKNTED